MHVYTYIYIYVLFIVYIVCLFGFFFGGGGGSLKLQINESCGPPCSQVRKVSCFKTFRYVAFKYKSIKVFFKKMMKKIKAKVITCKDWKCTSTIKTILCGTSIYKRKMKQPK